MWRILDEELLAGVSAAELHLRPARHARLLDADDYEAACAEVELVCQLWGGMADLLVPVNGDGTPDPYPTLLRHADVDAAIGRNASQLVPGLSSARLRRAPALLAAAAEDKDKFLELEVCTVSPQDPWHLGYLAALGILPETPDQGTLQDLMLREGNCSGT